jgi:hypothetical protein
MKSENCIKNCNGYNGALSVLFKLSAAHVKEAFKTTIGEQNSLLFRIIAFSYTLIFEQDKYGKDGKYRD